MSAKPTMTERLAQVASFAEHDPALQAILAEDKNETPEGALMVLTDQLREQAANGSAPANGSRTVDPVDSFAEAAPLLRRPFTEDAVKFKVQAKWPKPDPTAGLIVCYIDARLVIDRLNMVCPSLWHDRYEPAAGGMLWCHLTVDGIVRSDVGQELMNQKGLVSDALKRAAVKFGVGVSLYATPKIILQRGDHLKPKETREGKSLELTPNGQTRCRELYAGWLDTIGRRAFGEPLDHGDVADSAGDVEVDESTTPDETSNGSDVPGDTRDLPPADPEAEQTPEQMLAELLAQKDALAAKRKEADDAMQALGAGEPQRLRELLRATDKRAIDALTVRVNNAADGGS